MNEQLDELKRKYICINRKVVRILIISIVLIITSIYIHKFINWLNTDSMPPNIYRTNVTNGKDSLFITYYVGGLLGDVHKLIISDKIITGDKFHYLNYNTDSVFVFKEDLPIYYKFYNDTLFLYVNETVTEPKYFESNIKVITYDIDNDKASYPALREQYEKSLKRIEDERNALSMPY